MTRKNMSNQCHDHSGFSLEKEGRCFLFCFCFVISFLGLSVVTLAQEPNDQSRAPSAFDPGETTHGFSEFDTIQEYPSETTPNPLPYYKNLKKPHPLDKKPEGLFLEITLAEDFEEDLEFRRGNLYSPVRPSEEFPTTAPSIYVVFRVFKHYQTYQVIGQLYPETVEGWPSHEMLDEDMAYLASEDESGYLKFFPPSHQGWMPGTYRVEIFVGYEANAISKMGTLRFRVISSS